MILIYLSFVSKVRSCQPLPHPDELVMMHGVMMDCHNGTSIGSVCTFQCVTPGHVMIGIDEPLVMICQPDGFWNWDISSFVPHCQG